MIAGILVFLLGMISDLSTQMYWLNRFYPMALLGEGCFVGASPGGGELSG
jgi:hypothetical protein